MRKKLALFIFLLLSPWIFFDVDLGDQPYMTLVGWLMANHPVPPAGSLPYWFEALPVWGSFMQDFLIYKIFGPQIPFLVLRFVWVAWHIAIASILLNVLKRWWDEKQIALALCFTVLACTVGADHFTLTYYSVPVGYGVLSICFLALANRKSPGWAIASAVFTVLALSARFSTLPFFALFWITLLFYFVDIRRLYKYLFAGLALGLSLAYGFLVISHQQSYVIPGLVNFFSGVIHKQNIRFQGLGVVPKMLGHYLRILLGGGVFAMLTILLSKIRSKTLREVAIYVIFASEIPLVIYKYGIVISLVIGGALFILLLAFYQKHKSIELHEWILGLGSIMVLVAFPFGTYSQGLQFYKYGLWLLLPISFLMSYSRKQELFAISRRFLMVTIMILFFGTRLVWPTFPYHEEPLSRMNQRFQSSILRGIYTFLEKEKSIDGLVIELHKQGLKAGDTLFCYAGSPPYYPISILYLITATVPFLSDPGIVEYPGARWYRYMEMFKQARQSGALPSLVVRQKRYFAEGNLEQNVPFQWTGKENWLSGEMDMLLREFGYKPIWEDPFWVILKSAHP